MADDTLPMNDLDTGAAREPEQQPADAPQQQPDGRERDEQGRFAPKPDGQQPRGRPDPEAARRREAAERDEARRETSEIRGKYDALQKRLDDMAALASGKSPDEQQPDPLAALSTKVDGIADSLSQDAERRRDQETWNQVTSFADQDEARFRSQQPDFPDAVTHYITSRLTEMQALGLSQEQAEGALQREAQELLITSAHANRSPAETIYALAKARGYQAGTMPQMRNVTPAPARPAGGRSLGTGNGPAGGAMTAAQIAAMDDADYFAFKNTPEGKRAIRAAMGG